FSPVPFRAARWRLESKDRCPGGIPGGSDQPWRRHQPRLSRPSGPLLVRSRTHERRSRQAVGDDVPAVLHLGGVAAADLWLFAELGLLGRQAAGPAGGPYRTFATSDGGA